MISEREIAQKIIHTCLRVKPDEHVQISTYQHTIPLAEALAVECFLAGAEPYILLETDNLFLAKLSEIPVANLSKTPHYWMAATERLDAVTYLGGPEDPVVFSAGSPEKMAAMDQANKPLNDQFRQHKVREMWNLWGQCTPQRAQHYGIDYHAWRDSLNSAMGADYLALAATGKRLAEVLENGESVHITASGGTDITLHLAKRQVSVNDGIIDDADMARGSRFSAFPDGNVSLAPDEHSANGTIVFSPLQLWGKVIKDLRWVFKDGRLIDWSAAENGDVFEKYYTAATGDKDRFGFLAIGINPQAMPVGFTFLDWIAMGAVTAGIGGNLDDGGTNDSTYGQSGIVFHADLTVDGKALLKDGKLVG